MVLFQVLSGVSMFHGDFRDNIFGNDQLLHLHHFSLAFKTVKLEAIEDREGRNLVAQLLNKDPTKRTPLKNIAVHPFLTGRSAARLLGDKVRSVTVNMNCK